MSDDYSPAISKYGKTFDQTASEWRRLENEHDKMHPDRNDCGGVGGCPMMLAAADLEQRMIDHLDAWRKRNGR